MDAKIQESLDYWRNRLSADYGINHIFNISLYGSQNYNLATKESDVDVKAIYVPSLSEALFNKKRKSIELHNDKNEHCELKDIREMFNMYLKQNINFLETLVTEYRWENPLYKDIHKKLRKNTELITRYDFHAGVQSICGQSLNAISSISFDLNIPKTRKTLSKIIYFYIYLSKYLHTDTFHNYSYCLKINENDEFLHFKAHPLLHALKTNDTTVLNEYFKSEKSIKNILDMLYGYFKYIKNEYSTKEKEENNTYVPVLLKEIAYNTIKTFEYI